MAIPDGRFEVRYRDAAEDAGGYLRSLNHGSISGKFTCDIMWRMHAEAVKCGGTPSMLGLMHDSSRTMTCAECNASYHLHYDLDAEMRSTLFSLLAAELITARHPDHEQVLVLELSQRLTEESPKREVVWSTRLDLRNLRKKQPDII